MTKTPETAVIVVNWNGKHFLDACLSSLSRQTYRSFETYLVDNGSTDGSLEFMREQYPEVTLIASSENEGFARANNRGIVAALANPALRYVALLNNDTEVTPTWLAELVAEAAREPSAGLVASKILLFAKRDHLDSAGDLFDRRSRKVINRGHSEPDAGQFDERREVLTACAAACLIRREVLEAVGEDGEYFDSDFTTYVEDVDLALRARLLGWSVWYAPSARIYHVGSGTSSALWQTWKYRISARNRLFVALKDLPLTTLMYYLFPVHDAKRALARRLPLLPPAWRPETTTRHFSAEELASIYLGSLIDALPLVPTMLRKRRRIQKSRCVSQTEVARWFKELSQ